MAGVEVGAVVRLKSGGPRMTVRSVGNYNEGRLASCDWFVGGEAKQAFFPPTSLQEAGGESGADDAAQDDFAARAIGR